MTWIICTAIVTFGVVIAVALITSAWEKAATQWRQDVDVTKFGSGQ